MNLELHKELYFFEWNRKEQLSSYTNLPVALSTALAGGSLYLIDTFHYHEMIVSYAFIILVGLSAILQIFAIIYIFKSLSGYWYDQIPSPDKLQKYYEDLKAYHVSIGSPAGTAQQEFDALLQKRLAAASSTNRDNNARTGQALEKAVKFIVFALALSGVSFIPYLVGNFDQKPTVQQIQVDGPVQVESEAFMTHPDQQNQTPNQGQQPQQRPQTERPQPATRPVPPPNEQVRKGGGFRERR